MKVTSCVESGLPTRQKVFFVSWMLRMEETLDSGSMQSGSSGRSCSKGCLFFLIGAIVLCVAGVVLVNMAMNDFMRAVVVGKTGPVTSPADWPQPLKDLVTDAKSTKIDVYVLQVHQMNGAVDPEYIWQMRATPGLLELIKTRWKLSPIPTPDYGVFCGKSNLSGDSTPDWWSPKANVGTQFYACATCLAGEKGAQFQVAYDVKRGTIFVRYYDNF